MPPSPPSSSPRAPQPRPRRAPRRQQWPPPAPSPAVTAHPHRRRIDIRRAVLQSGLRPLPPETPRRGDQLLRRRQRRGHHRVQRQADRLRCLRRADERQRTGHRQRRTHHPSARRPGRRRRGLQHEPPGRRPAAPGWPRARPHLPRPDHHLERPGHHRAQPRYHPAQRADRRRPPLRRSGTTYIFSNTSPRQTRLGSQSRRRQDSQLASRGTRRGNSARPAVSRTAFSIGYVEQAYSRGLRLLRAIATGPALRHPRLPGPWPPPRPRNQPLPHRLLHRQPARRRQLPSAATAGLSYTPPNEPRQRAGSRRHAGLANPQRPNPSRRKPPTSPCPPKSSNSPTPCSSRSPTQQEHTSWAEKIRIRTRPIWCSRCARARSSRCGPSGTWTGPAASPARAQK